VGKDRDYESLKGFFNCLSEEERNPIEAGVMDRGLKKFYCSIIPPISSMKRSLNFSTLSFMAD
jgi:hypothetical protein